MPLRLPRLKPLIPLTTGLLLGSTTTYYHQRSPTLKINRVPPLVIIFQFPDGTELRWAREPVPGESIWDLVGANWGEGPAVVRLKVPVSLEEMEREREREREGGE